MRAVPTCGGKLGTRFGINLPRRAEAPASADFRLLCAHAVGPRGNLGAPHHERLEGLGIF
jgi:hypothetical protein